MRAGTERIVEREEAWFDFLDREAGDGAGKFRREDNPLWGAVFIRLVGVFNDRYAIGELQRGLETFRYSRLYVGSHRDPVDDDVDVVFELFVEPWRVGDFIKLPV